MTRHPWNSPPNATDRKPFRIQSAETLTGPWGNLSAFTNIHYTANRAVWTNTVPHDATNAPVRFFRIGVALE